MKHLIETADTSGLPNTEYDRIILDSATNEIVYRGGINTNGYFYVDLGIPSGILWATMNVGATSETDYGDYFQWGSTTPDTNGPCDLATAPFNNGSSSYDSAYFNSVKDTVCPNGILAKEYDVAAQIMRGDWRMPTKTDFRELLNNTTNEWTTINGVNGWKFTASNGKYIFIPTSGNRSDSSSYNQDREGYVWSSSLGTSNPNYAWSLFFDSDFDFTQEDERYYGHAVRGVCGGGVDNANILMLSETGYQLYGEEGDDGQINYWTFEYTGTEEYNGKEYFKYSLSETDYILAPTRNITKVTFPFDDYYISYDGEIFTLLEERWDSLYGFTSVPENKILMKRRTDIGTNANNNACVDLGLTSGTLWATMNVGASSETDYGSYFQWGETEPHDNGIPYDWANYKYCNGSDTTFTKYNTLSEYGENPDGKTTLDLDDDAARVNMRGDWRMPTSALTEELVSETTSEWVTNYKSSGINGRKFTGPNGNSIFIPASGYRSDSSLKEQGSSSFVWSSSLFAVDSIDARHLGFYSGGVFASGFNQRRRGYNVRGVL